MDDREELIRKRAHEIWHEEGRPAGRESEHWERAEKEVDEQRAAEVRPAGTEEMDLPPKRWDIVDEQADESFPASDPPGNY